MRLAKVAVVVSGLLGTMAFADPPWQDQRRVDQDARTTWNDRNDLERLRGLRQRLQDARAMRDRRALQSVDYDLQQFMHEEWSEARFKLYRAHGQLDRDHRDVRVNEADARANAYDGREHAANRDQQEAWHDRQDARQDSRDLQTQRWNLDRVQDIARSLNGLYGRTDYPALERKSYLIGQLVRLTEEQLAQDHADQHQDRHDQHEDRRDDRRDGYGPPPPPPPRY